MVNRNTKTIAFACVPKSRSKHMFQYALPNQNQYTTAAESKMKKNQCGAAPGTAMPIL